MWPLLNQCANGKYAMRQILWNIKNTTKYSNRENTLSKKDLMSSYPQTVKIFSSHNSRLKSKVKKSNIFYKCDYFLRNYKQKLHPWIFRTLEKLITSLVCIREFMFNFWLQIQKCHFHSFYFKSNYVLSLLSMPATCTHVCNKCTCTKRIILTLQVVWVAK